MRTDLPHVEPRDRRPTRPPARASGGDVALASVLLHILVLVVLWQSPPEELPEPPRPAGAIEIDLIAASELDGAEAEADAPLPPLARLTPSTGAAPIPAGTGAPAAATGTPARAVAALSPQRATAAAAVPAPRGGPAPAPSNAPEPPPSAPAAPPSVNVPPLASVADVGPALPPTLDAAAPTVGAGSAAPAVIAGSPAPLPHASVASAPASAPPRQQAVAEASTPAGPSAGGAAPLAPSSAPPAAPASRLAAALLEPSPASLAPRAAGAAPSAGRRRPGTASPETVAAQPAALRRAEQTGSSLSATRTSGAPAFADRRTASPATASGPPATAKPAATAAPTAGTAAVAAASPPSGPPAPSIGTAPAAPRRASATRPGSGPGRPAAAGAPPATGPRQSAAAPVAAGGQRASAPSSRPAPVQQVSAARPAPHTPATPTTPVRTTTDAAPQTAAEAVPPAQRPQPGAATQTAAAMASLTAPSAPAPAPPRRTGSRVEGSTYDVMEAVRQRLARFACTRLEAREDGEPGRIAVSGMLTSAAVRDAVVDLLTDVPGVTAVSGEAILTVDTPCPLLDFLNWTETEGLVDTAGPLPPERRVYTGQPVDIRLTTPAFRSHIIVDLYQSDGTVYHLDSNNWTAEPFPPNLPMVFGGAGEVGLPLTASPPFGRDFILAVASSQVLMPRPRPSAEPVDGYLKALSAAIEKALAAGAEIEVVARIVHTVALRGEDGSAP